MTAAPIQRLESSQLGPEYLESLWRTVQERRPLIQVCSGSTHLFIAQSTAASLNFRPYFLSVHHQLCVNGPDGQRAVGHWGLTCHGSLAGGGGRFHEVSRRVAGRKGLLRLQCFVLFIQHYASFYRTLHEH